MNDCNDLGDGVAHRNLENNVNGEPENSENLRARAFGQFLTETQPSDEEEHSQNNKDGNNFFNFLALHSL